MMRSRPLTVSIITSSRSTTLRRTSAWVPRTALPADRLGVTQAYLSMLERGRRSPAPLAHKLMQVYGLPPTVLPVCEVRENSTPDFLAYQLASLGYPGFAHFRGRARRLNPASFLL